ncbi:ABC transporter substrate-binding protein [Paenibacillus sp. Leaf72]|uniref:ABC transporter substrate-binding protein n=1 Tax=Paenibacillus sp. Leaf72 TaxID=1736234 RepID=UPI001F462F1F|nr:ABC transporter substrate-binding protein [Paenibacillus sp. Leaf72]
MKRTQMAKNKKTIGVLFSLCLLLALMGCSGVNGSNESGSNNELSQQSAAPSASTAAASEEIVLAAPRDLAPGPQDAYYTSTILYVWEPLISASEDGKPAPKLAEAWEMSADAKEWTFMLRKGVTFHDGAPFNADAVLANFARYKQVSPKSSPFYTLDINNSYPSLQEVVKVDDSTIKLVFDNPQPTLLYSMINFSSPMYSPNNFDENGDFNGLPQGTGPFKLVQHEKDQFSLLEAYDGYYGEKAKAQKIRVRVIPDPDTRLAALKSGEILGVMDLGAIPPALAEELLKDERFAVSTAKSTISHYLHPNGAKAPFNDVKMRQALSLMIDREQLVKELYLGYPTATANILNATSPFYKDIPVVHDSEKAIALAHEVLGDSRQAVTLIVPTYGLDRYPYKAQAELLQAVLQELQLDVTIQILDGAAYKEAQAQGNFDLALAIQGLPNGDPYSILNNYMASEGSSNISYTLGYSNAHVDELLKQVKTTLDMDDRAAIYNELQDIAAEELPTIPLFNDASLIAYSKEITGYGALVYGTTLPQLERVQ